MQGKENAHHQYFFFACDELVMDFWGSGGTMIFVIKFMAVDHYLYSLDASADNLSVVVFSAERTRMLALPKEMERTTITRPLRRVTVKENQIRETITSFKIAMCNYTKDPWETADLMIKTVFLMLYHCIAKLTVRLLLP